MKFLDKLSAQEAIELFYEKHHALREGNFTKLLELKTKCPEIFDKDNDAELYDMIEYAKAFQKTPRYKELQKAIVREQLTVIKNES